MISIHKILNEDSRSSSVIPDNSVDLIVTSPPYPMIEMWDNLFSQQNPIVRQHLSQNDGSMAFQAMHYELDKVWDQCNRILKTGGIACINIGDATRSVDGEFQLFSNHSRIIHKFLKMGFVNLPNILWRKQTNAPNKFMGSGMLPVGAYITLEHEYVLIFRKGAKREFNTTDVKLLRQESSFFWEERNIWFSDMWDLKGIGQNSHKSTIRERSAAYPFELAYRLINMYSVKGDYVYDPFVGTGTTTFAAIASARNSFANEIDKDLFKTILIAPNNKIISELNGYTDRRIKKHLQFIKDDKSKNGVSTLKYNSKNYNFPVKTKQEINILFHLINSIKCSSNNELIAEHSLLKELNTFENEELF